MGNSYQENQVVKSYVEEFKTIISNTTLLKNYINNFSLICFDDEKIKFLNFITSNINFMSLYSSNSEFFYKNIKKFRLKCKYKNNRIIYKKFSINYAKLYFF